MEAKKSSQVARKKRKRDVNPTTESDILRLESEVASSPKHYNHITTLISLARQWSSKSQSESAVLALCRIFMRLFSESLFRAKAHYGDQEGLVQRWLEDRYVEFTRLCLQALALGKPKRSILCLKVLMKFVQTEISYQGHKLWLEGVFYQVLAALLKGIEGDVRDVFVNDYVRKYDDVQFHMLHLLASVSTPSS
jgi:U3 small nucleolar RNA-associated protein 19